MRYHFILSTLLLAGCWTVQPTAVQKKERLDRATYQAKSLSGERFGGDEAVVMADSLIFKFNDIEWRNGVHLDSLAELNIASSGFGGLAGLLPGALVGGMIGSGILATRYSLIGGVVGFIVGAPVGIFFGVWVGTRLDKGKTLNFRTMTTTEKIETLKKNLLD